MRHVTFTRDRYVKPRKGVCQHDMTDLFASYESDLLLLLQEALAKLALIASADPGT